MLQKLLVSWKTQDRWFVQIIALQRFSLLLLSLSLLLLLQVATASAALAIATATTTIE